MLPVFNLPTFEILAGKIGGQDVGLGQKGREGI